jgi:hypothetical protein
MVRSVPGNFQLYTRFNNNQSTSKAIADMAKSL